MLDKRCLALLNIINGECVSSGYKVFSIDELISAMPEYFNADGDGIRECLKTLSVHEYISIKYEDESEVCLSPLTKGRLVFENRLDDEIEKNRTSKKYFLYSAVGALVGGIVSTVITIIIFAALGRI